MATVVHYLKPPNDLAPLRTALRSDIRLSSSAEGPIPPETEILIAGRPRAADLRACPALRAVVVPWSGIPEETGLLLQEHPHLSLHNLHHNAAPVAELALALLLAASKHLTALDKALRADDWRPRYQPSRALLLQGQTALVLGYGAIGRRVAALCRSLGMTVLAIRRRPDEVDQGPANEVHATEQLASLLPRAKALIVTLPLTPRTSGLIGAAELAALPRNAVLVNVGRAAIIDEEALYEALASGRLLGAGLDVWYRYPREEAERASTPPANFPFSQLDNVVFSPHRAGTTVETESLRLAHLAQLLNAAASGASLPNRVDLQAGY
ncbi:MAG: NAD(P)-dependent oxidoreductase [Candidatus Promineifilaceae bacterium]|nr:NAD(P)-dependent oxidoreductase [Candidatus Promineifilaceae bacterium]